MIKDILVNLETEAKSDPAATYALSVARLFNCHVTGVAYALKPVVPSTAMEAISLNIIDNTIARNEKAAKAAADQFASVARKDDISAETMTVTQMLDDATDHFARMARKADLSVVAQATPDSLGYNDFFVEAALFSSGRPVIVVPYIQKDAIKLDRVTCCWDGSAQAARAIADSLPLLRKAGKVDVLVIKTGKNEGEQLAGTDIAQHLARHGLQVSLEQIVAPDVDVPNTMLSYVADRSTDFLVMGGYGHSRFREFILGGATRGILSSMTVPTLMAH